MKKIKILASIVLILILCFAGILISDSCDIWPTKLFSWFSSSEDTDLNEKYYININKNHENIKFVDDSSQIENYNYNIDNQTDSFETIQTNDNPKFEYLKQNTAMTQEEARLTDMINEVRIEHGLAPLEADMEIVKSARIKAQDMVDNGYFDHYSPNFGSPFDMMRNFGIAFFTAAENLAGNYSEEGALDAWMNSPGHRANILSDSYNFTGIGIASGLQYGNIYVQQFAGR